MIEIIDDLPQQIEEAIEIGSAADFDFKGIKNVCIGGMGGSSVGGELLQGLAERYSKIPFSIVRDYELPSFVGSKTLMIIVSYSGNTEEILSLLDQVEDKPKILCVTSNGIVEDRAKEKKLPLILIPKGYPPRGAIAYLFFPILEVLRKSGIIKMKKDDIDEVIRILKDNVETAKIWAEEVSIRLKEKLPFIYSIYDFSAVAKRWCTQLNENSKSLSHFAVFSELDHNEIVGWENPNEILKRIFIFILRDREEKEKIKKRIEITAELIKESAGEIVDVYADGKSLLAKIFSLVQKGDYLSFYLAKNYKIDPLPVKRIQELKRRLAE